MHHSLVVSTIEPSKSMFSDDTNLFRSGFPTTPKQQSASIRRSETTRNSVLVQSQSMSMSVHHQTTDASLSLLIPQAFTDVA